MPNRILKESICVSYGINALSAFEETVFYRLIVTCDDYGRTDARPSFLKARLFPVKDVRQDQVEKAVGVLAAKGMVTLYAVEGKPYLTMTGWDRHQSIRAKKSKYPAPEDVCVRASESIGNHLQADAPVIQSVSESKSGSESVSEPCPGGDGGGFATDSRVSEANLEPMKAKPDAAEHRARAAGTVRTEAIEDKAKAIGMAWAASDITKAESLMASYSAQWLLVAMDRAANGPPAARSWRYIEGILRSFREKGGIDDVHERHYRGGQEQGRSEAPGADWAAMQLNIRRY